MPEIGEVKIGPEIGYRNLGKHIWHACEVCRKERWVQFKKGRPLHKLCCVCSGKKFYGEIAHAWKGGRGDAQGYIRIFLPRGGFFYSMCNKNGYILEHRLVMSKYLNRCLLPWEVVHHKNGIRNDNRIENLELLPHGRFHLTDMVSKSRIAQLEKKVTLLEAELAIYKKRRLKMNWRPPNWDKIYDENCLNVCCRDCFDVGADAMLLELRKLGNSRGGCKRHEIFGDGV